jgi:flagellar M-ring protein FliF
MKEIVDQIRVAWESLSLRQRMSLVFSAALTVLIVGAVVWWARQPDWTVLYTGLQPKDAQAVLQELQGQNVAHRVKDGGSVIEVPYSEVDRLRMDLAAKNLPESGRFGFMEMFNQDNFAQSNRMHQVRVQKALEDELGRTIETLEEVRSARVHLVLPGERVFLDDDDVAKASVTLGLARVGKIPSEQVQAIARIVSGAVPELSLELVNVVDTRGRVLWNGDDDAVSRQVEIKNAIESDINEKVARVVEPIVGPDGYVVRTTADLDLEKIVRRETQYDPDSGVLISEDKTKREVTSSDETGGAPGTASNLPGGVQGGAGASGTSESEKSTVNNFQYSVVEQQIEEPVGSIKRLSVAVLVDQKPQEGGAGSEGEPQPRSEEEIQRIEELVKAAISFSTDRGDRVTVEQTPFLRMTQEEPPRTFDPRPWLPFLKYPALLLLLLLAFLLFYRPLIRTVKTALETKGTPRRGHAEVEQPLQLGQPSQLELIRQKIASIAAEHPEGMAQTMRAWLHEGKE